MTDNVERLQRLKALTSQFKILVEWAVQSGGPWLEELSKLIDWTVANENPPPDVVEAFFSIQADLANFRAFVKAATARPDLAAAETAVSDGEPGPDTPGGGR